MALIENIEKENKDIRKQDPAYTTYSIGMIEDKKVFQLNMHGSTHRQDVGKVSQVIQFDQESAKKLIGLLIDIFGINAEELL